MVRQTRTCPACGAELAAALIPTQPGASFQCPRCGNSFRLGDRFALGILVGGAVCIAVIAHFLGLHSFGLIVAVLLGSPAFYFATVIARKLVGVPASLIPAKLPPLLVRDGDTKLDLSDKPKN
jgi:ribosomal protein S27AE